MNPPMQQELGALNFISEKALGVRSFYSGPNVISEHVAGWQSDGCVTLAAWHVTVRLTCLMPWQTIIICKLMCSTKERY